MRVALCAATSAPIANVPKPRLAYQSGAHVEKSPAKPK